MQRIRDFWARYLTDLAQIDLRSLAAFRIALAGVVTLDLLIKAKSLTAFYTDQGILPRELVMQSADWWEFSFHLASGGYWFQLLILIISVAIGLSLLFGYQTRIATILLWLSVLSLQNRNSLILHSGDALIRLMLFWSIFLPLGARWSIDNYWKAPSKAQGICNLASFAILIQLLSMYLFTALIKNHPEWNKDFLAIYYALQLEQFTTPLGAWLGQQLALTKFLTAVTFYLELYGPIALVVPVVVRYARWVVPLMFVGLHVSIAATMNLGMFPWICVAAWILFVPSGVWERLPGLKFPSWIQKLRMAFQLLPPVPQWQPARALTVLKQLLIAFGLLAITSWNVNTLPWRSRPVPEWIRTYALPVRLDQYWGMFAPYPMRADGWFVVDGKLSDGKSFDPWNGKFPVTWQKPSDFMSYYRSTAWRKYLFNIWVDEPNETLQMEFAKYVCREWNNLGDTPAEGQTLASYQLYYLRENTPEPGHEPIVDRKFLWTHDCFAKSAR